MQQVDSRLKISSTHSLNARKCVTMSYNETGTLKKRIIAYPRVFSDTASAPFGPCSGF